MANRTVIVDNNTWNNTHIATVGTAMSSPEKAAWEIFNSLDVKYVLVVFGGWCFMAHRGKNLMYLEPLVPNPDIGCFLDRACWLP
jgi:hypothetical protein